MQAMSPMLVALQGLAVGDAFGQQMDSRVRLPPWRWTDDTAMAISIAVELRDRGTIDPDSLAKRFADRFIAEPNRGYGAGAARLLTRVAHGASWRAEVAAMFGGKGSYGNGAAMRAAPIGAHFESLDRVIDEARRSAEPTHAHREGIAGAIAVAVAARLIRDGLAGAALLEGVHAHTPPGDTRTWIGHASRIAADEDPYVAATELGSGAGVMAQDTVPYAIWVIARSKTYEDAVVTATWGDGGRLPTDRDTLGAIVGGVMCRAVEDIPEAWREATEPLPQI